MKRNFCTKILQTTFCISLSFTSFSQEEILLPSPEMQSVEVIIIGEKKIEPIADLKPFNRDMVAVTDTRDHKSYTVRPSNPEEIRERLKSLENVMPLNYNEDVQKYIDYFTLKRPSFTREMMEKKDQYFPVFEQFLKQNNMPEELKYLALLESGLNPKAVSRSKAIGMWQFMTPTGREMGLNINEYIDERMHVEKSTQAACKYMRQLYNMFYDWEMALASYNTGPGNIRRAIRKSGQTDYWSLHPFIHPDTRAYVPQWTSLVYLMNYGTDHGIFPDSSKMQAPFATESILLSGYTDLKKLAHFSQIDFKQMMGLNTHLKVDKIPAHFSNFELKIPAENYAYFEENQKMILDSASKIEQPIIIPGENENPTLLANNTQNNGEIVIGQRPNGASNALASNNSSEKTIVSYRTEYNKVKHYHKVKSGDHLNNVSDRYGVSISQLKEWNNLRSSKILKGQRLVYYTQEKKRVPVYGHSENQTAFEKLTENKNSGKTLVTDNGNKVVVEEDKAAEKFDKYNNVEDVEPAKVTYTKVNKTVKKYHKVVKGDNLTHIADKYNVSLSDLKEWNNMRSSKVLLGQKLVYYTNVSETVARSTASSKGKTTKSAVHVVEKGDTLWNIAQRYDGLTVEQIKKLNNLSDNNVKVGQKLKVKS